MALTRSEAEAAGVAFSQEDERFGAEPDQPVYRADITRDGHTIGFSGKSEEGVLEEVERFLKGRGEIESEDGAADIEPLPTQSVDELRDEPEDDEAE